MIAIVHSTTIAKTVTKFSTRGSSKILFALIERFCWVRSLKFQNKEEEVLVAQRMGNSEISVKLFLRRWILQSCNIIEKPHLTKIESPNNNMLPNTFNARRFPLQVLSSRNNVQASKSQLLIRGSRGKTSSIRFCPKLAKRVVGELVLLPVG